MAYDFVFIGGGLSSALSVLAVLERRPTASIAVIEQQASLGHGHTWCFHARDVPAESARWLDALVVQRWPGYSVRFPKRTRRLASAYACVSSEQLHRVVSERCAHAPGVNLLFGRTACEIGGRHVTLDDGSAVEGKLVIDARGPQLTAMPAGSGYQKFVGIEFAVAPGHDLTEPILMDAMLPQQDGFRFMYALPFGRERVLIEDTYFSDEPSLDEGAAERAIWAYTKELGLTVRSIVRRERGVLPMPSSAPLPNITEGPIFAGYRGGYFHPVTGYSFPLAVRFAEALAATDSNQGASSPLQALAQQHGAQLPFLFGLTRMMFTWFAPAQRYTVLEHFYRLPEANIERFYAAQLRPLDRARMFIGLPPRGISLRRALGLHPRVSS